MFSKKEIKLININFSLRIKFKEFQKFFLQTTLRIWDCLFYEGSKIIFRVALTLIKRNKENLLACQDFAVLAGCFKEITKDSIVLHCHDFMQVFFQIITFLYLKKIYFEDNKYFSISDLKFSKRLIIL